MHDWSETVHRRLASLPVGHVREAEIRAELAGHLEEVYDDAIRRGYREHDAVAYAMAHVPDWADLARTIGRAEHGENHMSPHSRTVLLPGMSTLIGAAAFLSGVTLWSPPGAWADPRTYVHVLMAAFALSVYMALGAVGAAWSRRAGGTPRERLVAGVFPLLMHIAVVGPAIAAGMLTRAGLAPMNFQPGVVFALIVAPGAALAIGALPFLRGGAGAAGADVRRAATL